MKEKIINLMENPISLVDDDGEEINSWTANLSIPPTLLYKIVKSNSIAGAKIYIKVYMEEYENDILCDYIPPVEDGIYYIVPEIIALALKRREDLLVPNTKEVKENGTIVCDSFYRIS